MKHSLWILGVTIATLTALNAICWGKCIRETGDPQLTLVFLFRLVFNKWYLSGLALSLMASILSYTVLRRMGVLAERFFLSIGIVATILVCTVILGD